MYEKDEIVINGITLNEKQKIMLIEAIGGHVEFGVQCSNFIEEEKGIEESEQEEIINEIDDMFIRWKHYFIECKTVKICKKAWKLTL